MGKGRITMVPSGKGVDNGKQKVPMLLGESSLAKPNSTIPKNGTKPENLPENEDDLPFQKPKKKRKHLHDVATNLVELSVTYDQTKRPAVDDIKEPILDKPRFEYVAGMVLSQLSLNLAAQFASQNPKELFFDKDETAPFVKPRIIITNVIPQSEAGRAGTLRAGTLVEKINGQTINTYSEMCGALLSKTKFWTIQTADSFTVLDSAKVHDDLVDPERRPRSTACKAVKDGEQLMAMPKLMGAQYGINAVNKKIGISEQQVKARIRLAEKRAKETKEKKGWLLKKLDRAAASKPRANATHA